MFCISDIYDLVYINFVFFSFWYGFDGPMPLRYPAMLWQINIVVVAMTS